MTMRECAETLKSLKSLWMSWVCSINALLTFLRSQRIWEAESCVTQDHCNHCCSCDWMVKSWGGSSIYRFVCTANSRFTDWGSYNLGHPSSRVKIEGVSHTCIKSQNDKDLIIESMSRKAYKKAVLLAQCVIWSLLVICNLAISYISWSIFCKVRPKLSEVELAQGRQAQHMNLVSCFIFIALFTSLYDEYGLNSYRIIEQPPYNV